jgi:hypothetical protein
MKHLKKHFLVPLFAIVFFVFSSTVYASTGDGPSPQWSYLTMISAGMKINDHNVAKISVTCDSDMFDTNKVTAKCELQQLKGSWETIKSWSETKNDSYIMYTKEFAVAKKYSYRLKVTASVYKDSKLLETVTEYFNYGYYH